MRGGFARRQAWRGGCDALGKLILMLTTKENLVRLSQVGELEMALLAQLLAVVARPGDVVALYGDLGAGKTTFARAFIRAVIGNAAEEIPSPTYTLVQTYESVRFDIAHFDLYRLGDESEFFELGFEQLLEAGCAVIEWPERASGSLPETRLEIDLSTPAREVGTHIANDTRDVILRGLGGWQDRCRRIGRALDLLQAADLWPSLEAISFLAGDASARRYARLHKTDGATALLMDWPKKDDFKVVRDGKTYNELAHISDNVAPFAAVARDLLSQRLSAPEIIASDLDNGFIVLEDLGDRSFFDEVHRGADMAPMWRAATDALVALRGGDVPDVVACSDDREHRLPRFDRDAMWTEAELLADWYWPMVHDEPMPADARDAFHGLWNRVFDRLLSEPAVWCLRDYHSPNLVWLPDRSGIQQVGVIDFQDAVAGPAAYDLVSLLQDARVSVPEALERELLEQYCARVIDNERAFDKAAFAFSYAAMGAQRNTKILGIFARLARRDMKPQYLSHIPRIWGYLERNLQHPELHALSAWYQQAFKEGSVLAGDSP